MGWRNGIWYPLFTCFPTMTGTAEAKEWEGGGGGWTPELIRSLPGKLSWSGTTILVVTWRRIGRSVLHNLRNRTDVRRR